MQLGRLFHVAFYEDALLLPRVALCGVAAAALAGPALWRSLLRDDPMSGLRLLLAGGLCGVGILFRATTLNQPLVGVAFAFLIGGLVHASLGSPLFSGARRLRQLAGLLLVAAAAFDALYLSVYVNPRRVVHEIFFDAQRAGRPRTPALSFMHYQVNPFYRTSAAQLDRTIAFLRRQPENFLLIGDSSILYGLTGKPSVSPSLWFHDGLTAPPRDSAAFARHAERMMQRVEQYGVRWVVLEGKRTGMQSKLEQYPRLLAQLEASRCQVHQFGGFQIQRLDPEGRCKDREPSAGPEEAAAGAQADASRRRARPRRGGSPRPCAARARRGCPPDGRTGCARARRRPRRGAAARSASPGGRCAPRSVRRGAPRRCPSLPRRSRARPRRASRSRRCARCARAAGWGACCAANRR